MSTAYPSGQLAITFRTSLTIPSWTAHNHLNTCFANVGNLATLVHKVNLILKFVVPPRATGFCSLVDVLFTSRGRVFVHILRVGPESVHGPKTKLRFAFYRSVHILVMDIIKQLLNPISRHRVPKPYFPAPGPFRRCRRRVYICCFRVEFDVEMDTNNYEDLNIWELDNLWEFC